MPETYAQVWNDRLDLRVENRKIKVVATRLRAALDTNADEYCAELFVKWIAHDDAEALKEIENWLDWNEEQP